MYFIEGDKEFSLEGSIEIFEGVFAKKIYIDGRAMVLYVYLTGDVPIHSHPHLQMGVVLKGEAEFTVGDSVRIVKPGMYYLIPSGVKHGVKLRGSELLVVDVFIPPREDYLEKIEQ